MNIDQVKVFMDHIREHAVRYFPGFVAEQTDVDLIDKQERPAATLYRFQVKDEAQVRSIIVKVPLRTSSGSWVGGIGYEKPLLFPKVESREMHRLQYQALVAIDEYFRALDKKQLGAIRVLDYLPQYHAIFTEELRDPDLRQLLLRESRLHPLAAKQKLTVVFQNAGTWLCMYHTMPKKEDVHVRDQHRDDYVEAINQLTSFLGKSAGNRSFFQQISSIIINQAQEILPEALPLGLGHGDYAMRNILVSPNARVTVLDTFSKWRTPIYEDIGYFLSALQTTFPQVISQGLTFSRGQLDAYEQAFLKGYFGQKSIPYPAIRLYEILALLDKWSSVRVSSYRRGGKLKIAGRAMAALTSPYFKRYINSLLKELTALQAGVTTMNPKRSY